MLTTTSVTEIWSTTIEDINNSTEEDYEYIEYYEYLRFYELLSSNIVTVVSSLALIAGATSWTVAARWRSFKNYVFLNMILSALLYNLATLLADIYFSVGKVTRHFILLAYSSTLFSFNLWMLIVCLMFYSDIVKVYQVSVKRRYLKSALLGWGLPSLTFTILAIMDYLLEVEDRLDVIFYALITLSTFLFMFVNLVLYLRVLCLLAKPPSVRRSGSFACSKVQVSTVLFLMTGAASLPSFFFVEFDVAPSWCDVIVSNVTFMPIINSCIYLFGSKNSRKVWKQYYYNLNRLSSVHSSVV